MGTRAALLLLLLSGLALPACASGGNGTGGGHDAGTRDGGSFDAGIDAARPDSGPRDAGMPDPTPDTGTFDANDHDANDRDANDHDGGGRAPFRCPAGQALVGLNAGTPTCADLAPAITAYFNASCSLFAGQRDSCDGCDLPPTRWGRVSDAECETLDATSTCQTETLGSETIRLYGLNPSGDVDGNDKIYLGFDCDPVAAGGTATGACPEGQFVTGTNSAGAFTCAPIGTVAQGDVRSDCWLYLGWQDSCSGCGTPPTKWGRVHGDTCESGAGTGGSCARAQLNARSVMMYGLDIDGDFNDDDELYLGLHCDDATASETTVLGACPAGSIAIGFGTAGSIVCSTTTAIVQTTVNTQCYTYLGWRDGCTGCVMPPTKWGRSNGAMCENGGGVNASCVMSPTTLFGLNTDGNVNGDDKFYFGMHCF